MILHKLRSWFFLFFPRFLATKKLQLFFGAKVSSFSLVIINSYDGFIYTLYYRLFVLKSRVHPQLKGRI